MLLDGEGQPLPTNEQANEATFAQATGAPETFDVRGGARLTPPDTADGIGAMAYAVSDEVDSRVEVTFIGGSGSPVGEEATSATFVVDREPAPTCNAARAISSFPANCAIAPVVVPLGPTVPDPIFRRDFALVWLSLRLGTSTTSSTLRTRLVRSLYGVQVPLETRTEPDGSAFDVVSGTLITTFDAISLDGSRILLVWQERDAGDVSVTSFQVLSAGLAVEIPRTELGRSPNGVPERYGITLAKSGERILIAWGEQGPDDTSHVVFRMMDLQGRLADGGSRVLSFGPGEQTRPSATGLSHRDGFAVAWEASGDSSHADNSETGVRMVLLDSQGDVLFANSVCSAEAFQVNEEHSGAQERPALTTLIDGTILAVWTGTDLSGTGVRSRSFRPRDLLPIE